MTYMESTVSTFPRRYDMLMNMHHLLILGSANSTAHTAHIHKCLDSSKEEGYEMHRRHHQI